MWNLESDGAGAIFTFSLGGCFFFVEDIISCQSLKLSYVIYIYHIIIYSDIITCIMYTHVCIHSLRLYQKSEMIVLIQMMDGSSEQEHLSSCRWKKFLAGIGSNGLGLHPIQLTW